MNGADGTIRYAGFWIRVAAGLIDSMLFSVLLVPALIAIYGIDWLLGDHPVFKIHGVWEVLLTYVLPAFVSIVFWIYATRSLLAHHAAAACLQGLRTVLRSTTKATSSL